MLRLGFGVSLRVTLNVQGIARLPLVSTAVICTSVVPIPKTSPELCVDATDATLTLSDTIAATQVTTEVVTDKGRVMLILIGQ